MEGPRSFALVVLTLLQLCRAEYILPQWYSVNLNEGIQPKPITDIFSTDPSFSTAKPIVVTQKTSNSISDEHDLLSSTYAPPTSRTFTKYFDPTSISTPIPALYQQNQNNPLKVDILPQQQNYLQPNLPTYVPPIQLIQHADNEPQLQIVSDVPAQLRKINVQQQIEPLLTYSPNLPLNTLFQPQTETTNPTSSSQDSKPQQGQPILAVTDPSTSGSPAPNSNYFLIYQQAPQSFQYPTSSQPSSGTPEVTIRQSTPTTYSLPTRTSEAFPTTRIIPLSSLSTTPLPTTWSSTTPRPADWTSTVSSSSVKVTPSSTFGLSNGDCIKSSTAIPSKKAAGLPFPLKIRVIAPTGSITNLNINPQTTTKRPYRVTKLTTTRKPTTRRTSKPKKNSYDRCLDGCKKVKDPICAAPLSHHELDPKKLRGFPSVCHMACHNSYKKDPFEKVIEGSCSKLRTRIRLIDSRNKLKKEELKKTEYFTNHNGPKTVIELSGLA